MNNYSNLVLIVIGAILPSVFALYVFLSHERAYAYWAKLVSLLTSVGGLIWGVLDWIFVRSQIMYLSSVVRGRLTGLTGIVGGVVLGALITILIARPYTKRDGRP